MSLPEPNTEAILETLRRIAEANSTLPASAGTTSEDAVDTGGQPQAPTEAESKELAEAKNRDAIAKIGAKKARRDFLQSVAEQEHKMRLSSAKWIAGLSGVWLTYVGFVIGMVGSERWKLSEPVLIALMTATTVDIIGLVYYVVNYLFYRDKMPERFPGTKKDD